MSGCGDGTARQQGPPIISFNVVVVGRECARTHARTHTRPHARTHGFAYSICTQQHTGNIVLRKRNASQRGKLTYLRWNGTYGQRPRGERWFGEARARSEYDVKCGYAYATNKRPRTRT